MNLPARPLAAEALGTMLLVATVVGSGIMGERLSDGNIALALLANALATAAMLYVLISWLAPISGAHFNPLVTLAFAWRGDVGRRLVLPFIAAQCAGGVAGTALAHLMFALPLFAPSAHARTGGDQWLSEMVATFGLVSIIWAASKSNPRAVPAMVGAYIGAAYWFTASTSFANPAVTLARALTGTFSGIRPFDVPAFLAAQIAGAVLAVAFGAWLHRTGSHSAR